MRTIEEVQKDLETYRAINQKVVDVIDALIKEEKEINDSKVVPVDAVATAKAEVDKVITIKEEVKDEGTI